MQNNTPTPKKDDSIYNYMIIGGLAIGGIALFSSFSSASAQIPTPPPAPPLGGSNQNPNQSPTYGHDITTDKGYAGLLRDIGYSMGAIATIYAAFGDIMETRDRIRKIKEDTEDGDSGGSDGEGGTEETAEMGIWFQNKGLFMEPGDWAPQFGQTVWGANPGGAFKFEFKGMQFGSDINSYLRKNNFSQQAFNNAFSPSNFSFSTANLFSQGGNWNFTPGGIPGGGMFGLGKNACQCKPIIL